MSGDQLNLDAFEAQANSGFLTHQQSLALVAEVRRLRAENDHLAETVADLQPPTGRETYQG